MAKAPIKKILVTGSVGQIGSELALALRERYGAENVVATGRKTKPSKQLEESGPFEFIDVAKRDTVEWACDKYDVNAIVHMAAILSAVGEQNPMLCWDVNMNGTLNVLEVAREREMAQVLVPSSIAAFGPETPRDNTPQETVLKPRTMYGVTKVAGELVCDYYFHKYGLDVRGLRYPGIISAETPPGGGTTDYAVAIYYAAVKGEPYECFVREDTVLPMMYMPDCLKATVDLMAADLATLKHHSDFNVGSMSFSAGELAASIRKYVPDFKVTYEPDFRQAIADSWPRSLDDAAAREEWGWAPAYDLDAMTQDMLEKLGKKYEDGTLPEMG
jgi:nucleoside-diphosphate-sugar epimerase